MAIKPMDHMIAEKRKNKGLDFRLNIFIMTKGSIIAAITPIPPNRSCTIAAAVSAPLM